MIPKDPVFPQKIPFPLLGILYKCCWIRFRLFLHKFQIAVPVGSFYDFIVLKDLPLRYFVENSLLTGWFLSAKICQTSLPPKAKIANSGSLICNPPSLIGLLIVSQLTKWILFWLPFPSLQRKALRILAIWTKIDLGARSNEDWKWEGKKELILSKPAFLLLSTNVHPKR